MLRREHESARTPRRPHHPRKPAPRYGHARRPKFLHRGGDVVGEELDHRLCGEVRVLRGTEHLRLAPSSSWKNPDVVASVAETKAQDPQKEVGHRFWVLGPRSDPPDLRQSHG